MTVSPAPVVACLPQRLTVGDLRAILAQAVDPEAIYKIDGWVVQALAAELLGFKAKEAKGRHATRHEARDDLLGQLVLFEEDPTETAK